MNTKSLELKKHSAIIQMSHRVSLLQRKTFNGLIFIARDALKTNSHQMKFSINISTLKKISGLASTNNKKFKEAIEKLTTINVKYNVLNKDNQEEWSRCFNMLAGIDIKDGVIDFSFPHQIHETLLDPGMFSILDLNIIKGLQNKYSIALYELSKDYINAAIPRMSLITFRELMGLNNEKYKNSKDLKVNVIEPAINEISGKTDLKMSYEFFHSGRKVTAIKFHVFKKQIKLIAEDKLF